MLLTASSPVDGGDVVLWPPGLMLDKAVWTWLTRVGMWTILVVDDSVPAGLRLEGSYFSGEELYEPYVSNLSSADVLQREVGDVFWDVGFWSKA